MQLGDYGVTDGAGFQKLGNIADFGLRLEIEAGRPSSLNLVSSGVKQTRLAAGAAVPAFQGLGDVAGKLGVEFTRANPPDLWGLTRSQVFLLVLSPLLAVRVWLSNPLLVPLEVDSILLSTCGVAFAATTSAVTLAARASHGARVVAAAQTAD